MYTIGHTAVLIPLLALAGCDEMHDALDGGRYNEDFHYSYALPAGSRLDLENANGGVEIAGWERDTADVSGTKYARTEQELRSLKIDVSVVGGVLRVRTIPVPGARNYGARYTIRVPRRLLIDRLTTSNGSVRVDGIEGTANLRSSNGAIRVWNFKGPLEARTSNGSIETSAMEGNATLTTTNGGIRTEVSQGTLEATTTNGSIHARMTGTDTQPVRLESTNGSIEVDLRVARDLRASTSNSSITLRLPSNAGARVRAHTGNSSVQSDFEGLNGPNKNTLEGNIGSGGPLITLETSNGHIKILKQ